jgi:hypothetical protein
MMLDTKLKGDTNVVESAKFSIVTATSPRACEGVWQTTVSVVVETTGSIDVPKRHCRSSY